MCFVSFLNKHGLYKGALVLASGSEEARVAATSSSVVIADSASRAVSASLCSITVQRVSTGGALLKFTSRASVSSVAVASDVLHVVPRLGVQSVLLICKVLLWPADTSVIAVHWAHSTLASNTVVSREAFTSSGLSVARTLVGALHPRVKIVGVYYISNPGEVLRACSQRAISSHVSVLAVQTYMAPAVNIKFAHAVTRARVLAESARTRSLLIKGILMLVMGTRCRLGSGSGTRRQISCQSKYC